MTTHPTPRPGEYLRDIERLLAQARGVAVRAHDDEHAFPPYPQPRRVLLAAILDHVDQALADLGDLAELDDTRAGSAVPVPVPVPSNGGHPPFGLPSTPRVPSFASYTPQALPLRRAVPGVTAAADRAAGGWNWERDS